MSVTTEIASAFATLAAIAGGTAQYKRGTATVSLSAIPRNAFYEFSNADGTVTTFASMDFVLHVATLGLTPQSGDTVIYGGSTYTVLPIGSGPCWTWSDADKTLIKVHTKIKG